MMKVQLLFLRAHYSSSKVAEEFANGHSGTEMPNDTLSPEPKPPEYSEQEHSSKLNLGNIEGSLFMTSIIF